MKLARIVVIFWVGGLGLLCALWVDAVLGLTPIAKARLPNETGHVIERVLLLQQWLAVVCGLIVLVAIQPKALHEGDGAGAESIALLRQWRAGLTLWALAGMLIALLLVHGVATGGSVLATGVGLTVHAFCAVMLLRGAALR